MVISRVAHRYAEAIFGAVEPGDRAAFMADVDDLQASLVHSRDLELFFSSPIIERAKKSAVVEELCAGRFGAMMHSVLLLLVDKQREALLPEILEALRGLYRKEQGIKPMTVTTAVAMADSVRSEIHAGLESLAKGTVEVDYKIDEALLGGIVVRMDDTVYDGSVERQLTRLRKRLTAV